jgi:adenine-specific DNA-methyltransferase
MTLQIKDMDMVSLRYPGKIDKNELYKEVKPAKLVVVKEFKVSAPLFDDGWHNLLILGDNLPVLRSFMDDHKIRGKVRLVYIDPPFGTGSVFRGKRHVSASFKDEIAYHDMPLSPKYLEFLRRRLIFLYDILAEDGSIYVHIDIEAAHYVKILMDEIFGIKAFLNDIARVKCNPKNFERKAYGNIRDSILFYAKNPGKHIWNEPREPYTAEDVERLFPKVDKDGRRYTTVPLHAPGETVNGPTGQPWRGIKPPPGRHWRYPPEVLDELDKKGLIEWSSSGNPRLKIYADDYIKKGKRMQDIWLNYKDPPYPEYPTEKNLEMVMKIIETSSNPDDIVLDAFCGSGTTAVAAEKLRRKWICIDISPIAIRTALKKILELKTFRPFLLINATGKGLPEDLKTFIESTKQVISKE